MLFRSMNFLSLQLVSLQTASGISVHVICSISSTCGNNNDSSDEGVHFVSAESAVLSNQI